MQALSLGPAQIEALSSELTWTWVQALPLELAQEAAPLFLGPTWAQALSAGLAWACALSSGPAQM